MNQQLSQYFKCYYNRNNTDLTFLQPDYTFEVRIEIDVKQVYRSLQKLLSGYKEEKRGPSVVVVQSAFDFQTLVAGIPALQDYPMIPIHVSDGDNLYNVLDWQRIGAKCMINHFLKYPAYLQVGLRESSRETDTF